MRITVPGLQQDLEGMDTTNDVLNFATAEILKPAVDLRADDFADKTGNQNFARRRQCLEPCRNIHTITADVPAFNEDVTQIHPNPEQHPPFCFQFGIHGREFCLQFHRATHGIDSA